MHAGQADIPATTVAALVAHQLPHWRDRPITPVTSHGTVNALYRLGDDIVLRFPLQPVTHPEPLRREQDHARRLQPHVPVALPTPLALGEPGEGYEGYWTAYTWIDGRTATTHDIDPTHLAEVVRAIHRVDTKGETWNGHSRGGPLHDQDEWVRHSLDQSRHLTDTARLADIWRTSLAAAAHPGPDVWIHADLMPGNLIVRDHHLHAVIDLGAVCAGDPAVDHMPAWNLFDHAERRTFRDALGADDDAWHRGRGWALVQAIGALWYYADTNPVMAATSRTTLNALLER
ncbi:aminoglycoside phosphotransferase family protein [Actinoplanes sp. NPDC089786]|uniref:aminoglycoside phosphotransferase family protein n=1 Tax=Actinoplanes sp. NPDC089786 TaxID=3155185 RepID=UPI00343E7F2B